MKSAKHARERKFGKVAVLLFCLVVPAAHAAWPDKPIRWITPAAAGGAADAAVRVVTSALAVKLGQPLVIENKPGAAGAIGLDAIAKAKPDGYTIGTANLSNFVILSNVQSRLPYTPSRDFTPIARLTTQPNLLAVNPRLPVSTTSELVAYAKKNPGRLFYGSSGTGSALHVVTELFRSSAGIELVHVPYKSSVAAGTDLAGGQIQMMIDNLSTMVPSVKAGRIKAIAQTGHVRSPLLPNVPTMTETGFPSVEMVTWGGVVGPARMPADIVTRLNAEIHAVLKNPDVKKQLAELGFDPAPLTPEQFADLIRADNVKWGAVVKKANITAD